MGKLDLPLRRIPAVDFEQTFIVPRIIQIINCIICGEKLSDHVTVVFNNDSPTIDRYRYLNFFRAEPIPTTTLSVIHLSGSSEPYNIIIHYLLSNHLQILNTQ